MTTKYGLKIGFSCKSSTSVILSPPSKTRRRFTQKQNEKVRLHYYICGNFAETPKTFAINESTV